MIRALALALVAVSAPAVAAQERQAAKPPPTMVNDGAALRLNIADRKHDAAAPKQGWCGENAVQQALLYHGAYFPQKLINQAGKPSHPDLYSGDIPVALRNLQVDFEQWPWKRCAFDKFLAWAKGGIAKGEPVLAGMKIYPTAHPEWGLDHFVLLVGFEKDALLVNTTWGKQARLTTKQLLSTNKGLAFKNRYGCYYGIRIKGLKGDAAPAPAARLFVTRETKEHIDVIVKCERLTAGQGYALGRWASLEQRSAHLTSRFTATGPAQGFRDTIPTSRPAIYRCRRAD